jgi:hypothetical protein
LIWIGRIYHRIEPPAYHPEERGLKVTHLLLPAKYSTPSPLLLDCCSSPYMWFVVLACCMYLLLWGD